jgi:hypothetical protein
MDESPKFSKVHKTDPGFRSRSEASRGQKSVFRPPAARPALPDTIPAYNFINPRNRLRLGPDRNRFDAGSGRNSFTVAAGLTAMVWPPANTGDQSGRAGRGHVNIHSLQGTSQ